MKRNGCRWIENYVLVGSASSSPRNEKKKGDEEWEMKLSERTFEPQFSLLLCRWRKKVMTSGLLGFHNKETHINQFLRIKKSKIRKNISILICELLLLNYSVLKLYAFGERLTLVLIKIIFLWKNLKRKEIRQNSDKMLLCCF